MPLAKLLSLGIQKLNQESAGKTREELNKELDADLNQPIEENGLIL